MPRSCHNPSYSVATARSASRATPTKNVVRVRRLRFVIDAGYNAGNVGDVEFSSARTRARLITPVPGGVGPMTIATLLAQTIDAAERQTMAKE